MLTSEVVVSVEAAVEIEAEETIELVSAGAFPPQEARRKEEANKREKIAQIQFNSWQFENYEDTKLTLIETVLTEIEKDLKKKQSVIKNGIDFLKKIKYLKLGVLFLKKIGQQVVPEELLKLLPTKEEWKFAAARPTDVIKL